MPNRYYSIAEQTLNKLESKDNLNSEGILECWKESLFDFNVAYLKGCPKNAFTSIVLNNHVSFDTKKNIINDSNYRAYDYCIVAIQILNENSQISFSASQLWNKVIESMNIVRSHQGEMDVVLALWDKKKLIFPGGK